MKQKTEKKTKEKIMNVFDGLQKEYVPRKQKQKKKSMNRSMQDGRKNKNAAEKRDEKNLLHIYTVMYNN